MNRNASTSAATAPRAETPLRQTQLRGWQGIAARVAWVLVMAWIVASFAASLPSQLYTFQHPNAHSTELAPGAVAALQQAGISLATYAWVAVVFGSLIMLAATALALVLFWRRGDDWMVLLVSLLFPAYCSDSIGPTQSFTATPTGSPLAVANVVLLAAVTFAIIYAVFMLFPSGRFVPSWSWALLVMFEIWIAVRAAKPTLVILFLGYPIFLGAAVACQIYRYRKVSTAVQRQQTRWAVFGLVTALLANQAFFFTCAFTPLGSTIYPPIAYLVLYGSVLLIPITFFIAIQRYRLYEIDVIIRRTLIYGALTTVLAAVYAAAVYTAQVVGGRLTGLAAPPPWVIVIVTLLVAALFNPLRQRIQRGIDRAFYRSKYDATRTIEAFAATLRGELDLAGLSTHLVEVVQVTMRPAHISLWLRPLRPKDATTSTGEGQAPASS